MKAVVCVVPSATRLTAVRNVSRSAIVHGVKDGREPRSALKRFSARNMSNLPPRHRRHIDMFRMSPAVGWINNFVRLAEPISASPWKPSQAFEPLPPGLLMTRPGSMQPNTSSAMSIYALREAGLTFPKVLKNTKRIFAAELSLSPDRMSRLLFSPAAVNHFTKMARPSR